MVGVGLCLLLSRSTLLAQLIGNLNCRRRSPVLSVFPNHSSQYWKVSNVCQTGSGPEPPALPHKRQSNQTAMTSPKKDGQHNVSPLKMQRRKPTLLISSVKCFALHSNPSWQVSSVGCVSTTEWHGVVGTIAEPPKWSGGSQALRSMPFNVILEIGVFLFYTHVRSNRKHP